MSAGPVRAAFRASLDAAIAAGVVSAPRIEVVNTHVPPPSRPDEYVVLRFYAADEDETPIGAEGERRFVERGTVFADVVVPAGAGDARAVAIADEVRALFRARSLGPATQIEQVSPPDTDDDDRGATFVATVRLAYRHEIIA